MAEEVGFEPTVPCGTTVFKTAAFDLSATPPTDVICRELRSKAGLCQEYYPDAISGFPVIIAHAERQ
jgi:hypothetical protein